MVSGVAEPKACYDVADRDRRGHITAEMIGGRSNRDLVGNTAPTAPAAPTKGDPRIRKNSRVDCSAWLQHAVAQANGPAENHFHRRAGLEEDDERAEGTMYNAVIDPV